MPKHIHAVAGLVGLMTILSFWTSTVFSELFAGGETVALVKSMILKGMLILIPAMMVAGGSGRALAGGAGGAVVKAKKRRMAAIAGNGLLILAPSAFYLSWKANAGHFDGWFYGVQMLELVAGATNITLMTLNVRDGLRLSGSRTGPRNAVA
jgi:hypothetical protein